MGAFIGCYQPDPEAVHLGQGEGFPRYHFVSPPSPLPPYNCPTLSEASIAHQTTFTGTLPPLRHSFSNPPSSCARARSRRLHCSRFLDERNQASGERDGLDPARYGDAYVGGVAYRGAASTAFLFEREAEQDRRCAADPARDSKVGKCGVADRDDRLGQCKRRGAYVDRDGGEGVAVVRDVIW